MSLVFNGSSARQGVPDSTSTVQKLLDENSQLIAKIKESQDQGKINEALPYQNLLHRNLVYLAKAADHSLLNQLKEDPNPSVPESSQSQIPTVVEPPHVAQQQANQNTMGGQQMIPQMGIHPSQGPMNVPAGMGPVQGYQSYHQGGPSPNFGSPNPNPYEQQMMYQQQLPPGQQPPYMHPR